MKNKHLANVIGYVIEGIRFWNVLRLIPESLVKCLKWYRWVGSSSRQKCYSYNWVSSGKESSLDYSSYVSLVPIVNFTHSIGFYEYLPLPQGFRNSCAKSHFKYAFELYGTPAQNPCENYGLSPLILRRGLCAAVLCLRWWWVNYVSITYSTRSIMPYLLVPFLVLLSSLERDIEHSRNEFVSSAFNWYQVHTCVCSRFLKGLFTVWCIWFTLPIRQPNG